MLDLTVPAGQAPTDVLHAVIADTLDRAADLGAPAAHPPQVDDTLRRLAHARTTCDHDALDQLLRDLAIAAIAARVRLLALTPAPS